jgi:DNA adenine methylase
LLTCDPYLWRKMQLISTESSNNCASIPFLRWPGGKRWLLTKHEYLFPTKINRYIEPFVGSGAVFFGVGCKSAILSDTNRDLIEVYEAIKEDWFGVEQQLKRHAKAHSDEYYYYMRKSRPRLLVTRAARFIYLNRTCFNGIYRVNRQGEFNVPRGTRDSVLLTTDDFQNTSKQLECAKLIVSDFEPIIKGAKKGDFLFVDPPYTVAHNNNGFVKYNERIFTWADQVRLKESLVQAVARGAHFLMANANHPSLVELYGTQFDISVLERRSAVAGSAYYRASTSELLIKPRK